MRILYLMKLLRYFTSLEKNEDAEYDKDFIKKRAAFFPGFKMELLDILPDRFTAEQAIDIIEGTSTNDSLNILKEIFDTNYELESSAGSTPE